MPDKDETLDNDQDEILDDDTVETTDDVEDESTDTEDETGEEDDSQDDDSEESEDEESEEEEEPEFKKAFSQIKGDTPQEYAKNLEEAYKQSSKEGKLQAQKAKDSQARIDQIAAVVAKNPELAKLINESAGSEIAPTTDPALVHARQTMEQQMEKDYSKFAESHPEIETDPDLAEKVLAEVTIFGDAARKKGKILSMDEALNKAWISLGLNKEDSKETVATKAKETASKSRTNNTNKKKTKTPKLSDDQIAAGKKMGLTEKQMLDAL